MYSASFATNQGSTVHCNPSSLVELSISCRKLADKDVFSKSDPMCVLFMKEFGSQRFVERGRTDVVQDSLNPDFIKKFNLDYFFEERQLLRLEVYDVDSSSQQLDSHDFLGQLDCVLSEIVSVGKMERHLVDKNGRQLKSTIILTAEELSSCKTEVEMQWSARKLDKKDRFLWFGSSDPFLEFRKVNEDGSNVLVKKTEVIKTNLKPKWRPLRIPVRSLCNGDYDRPIKLICWDYDFDGGHDLIGECQTTLRELQNGPGETTTYQLVNPKKKARKSNYKHSGILQLVSCRFEEIPTFVEFLQGSLQIHCAVAVDFTQSNGDPRSVDSLHYLDPYRPNQYATALQAVMEVVQDYDAHKIFPAFGFGGKIPPQGVLAPVAVDGQLMDDRSLITSIMHAYNTAIRAVQLWGPTNFSPIINRLSGMANTYVSSGDHYFILVIVTDGVITDLPATKKAIISAARLPLSIIIVGVGRADFSAMEELDGDDIRVNYNGQYAERDIVQFVPFRDFVQPHQRDLAGQKARFAREVLAEVPNQVTEYMRMRGIKPKPRQERPLQLSQVFSAPSAPPPPSAGPPAASTGPPGQPPPAYPANSAPYPTAAGPAGVVPPYPV